MRAARYLNIAPLTLITAVVVAWNGSAIAQGTQPLAVPSEFVKYVRMPGTGDQIKRPIALRHDRFHDEVLVADSGHNRVVIFGADGVFRYAFTLGGYMTMPRDIAADPAGYIYVLGSTPGGQVIHKFDFDGVPVAPLDWPREYGGRSMDLRSLVCDEDGTLYALDHAGRRILVFEEGTLKREFRMTTTVAPERSDMPDELESGFALGAMACAGGTLFVPVGDVGTVQRYTTEGSYVGNIGAFGTEPGKLNFPVAVDVSADGLVAVLDRQRTVVVCFAPDGRFLGEFGGRGVSPGWFLGPSLLAVSAPDRIIVGQVYQNRIQICALPDFIAAGMAQARNTHSAGSRSELRAARAENSSPATSQRRSVAGSWNNAAADGEDTPSGMNTAQTVHSETYLEVSE